MRKFLLLLLLLALVCLVVIFKINTNPAAIISKLPKDINAGTSDYKLRYKIYLMGVFPLGEAVFQPQQLTERNRVKVYHLSATAQSAKYLKNIFSADAIFDSYVDAKNLWPIEFDQRIHVAEKKDSRRQVFYDQKNQIMTLNGVRRQILPNTQDPLSLLFNLRSMKLDNPGNIEMNLNTNQKNYIVSGYFTNKDLRIGDGVAKTAVLKVFVRRRDNNPYHQTRITMTVLKGKENIPVLIKVFSSGLLIYAKLLGVS